MEPQTETSGVVPESEQKFQSLKSNIFRIAFLASVASFFMGIVGFILTFISKKHRKHRKLSLIMMGIGGTGYLAFVFTYLGIWDFLREDTKIR